MRHLTELEKAEIQAMTDSVAKTFKTRTKQADAGGDAGLTFSGAVNFSDTRPTDKADFGQPERTETALFDIKRLVARAGVQDSIKRFLTQRNEAIRRTKEKQKEKEKAAQNPNVSKPFWF